MTYFDCPGIHNTKETVTLVKEYAKRNNINYIVVASNTGDTALQLADSGFNVVCVTHVNGFREPGEMEITQEQIKHLHEKGIKVLTTTHILSGAERGLSRKFGGVYPVEIIAHTLRMFGQGVKVAVEVAVMALDAGLIPYNQEIIGVGGSGRGADAALAMIPSHGSDILGTWINEIICKPREKKQS